MTRNTNSCSISLHDTNSMRQFLNKTNLRYFIGSQVLDITELFLMAHTVNDWE